MSPDAPPPWEGRFGDLSAGVSSDPRTRRAPLVPRDLHFTLASQATSGRLTASPVFAGAPGLQTLDPQPASQGIEHWKHYSSPAPAGVDTPASSVSRSQLDGPSDPPKKLTAADVRRVFNLIDGDPFGYIRPQARQAPPTVQGTAHTQGPVPEPEPQYRDLRYTRLIEPNKMDVRDLPKRMSALAIVRLGPKARQSFLEPNTSNPASVVSPAPGEGIAAIGSLNPNDGHLFWCQAVVDFGRAELDPRIELNFRVASDPRAHIDTRKPKTFQQLNVIWRTGSLVGRVGGINKWQLNMAKAKALPEFSTHPWHNTDRLKKVGDACSTEQLPRLVHLELQGGMGQVTSSDTLDVFMKCLRTQHHMQTIERLLKSAEIDLDVYFLVPNEKEAGGSHTGTAANWAKRQFSHMQTSLLVRLPPYFAYLEKREGGDGWTRSIHLDMLPVTVFHNRALQIWTHRQEEAMEKEMAETGRCEYPESSQITKLNLPQRFDSFNSLAVFSQGHITREEQADIGMLTSFTDEWVEAFLVSPFKGERVMKDIGDTQRRQQKMIYIAVKLTPELKGTLLPGRETSWELCFKAAQTDPNAEEDPSKRWAATVIDFTIEEQALTGCDMLLKAWPRHNNYRPPRGSIAPDFDVNSGGHHQRYIHRLKLRALIDNSSYLNIMKAVDSVCDDREGHYHNRMLALVGLQPPEPSTYNATAGPNPNLKAQSYRTDQWAAIVKVCQKVWPYLDADQAAVAYTVPKAIDNQQHLVIGCPGAGKTTVAGITALCIMVVGHTVTVCAQQHKIIDTWARMFNKLLEEIKAYCELHHGDQDDHVPGWIIEHLDMLQVLRFVPTAASTEQFKQSDAHIEERGKILKTGGELPDEAACQDTRIEGLVASFQAVWEDLAQFEADSAAPDDRAGESEPSDPDLNEQRLKRKLTHIQNDIKRLRVDTGRAVIKRRELEYPFAFSLPGHAARLRRTADDELDPKEILAKQAVAKFDKAVEEFAKSSSNYQEIRQRSINLRNATEEMTGCVIGSVTMLLSTYVGAQHAIPREHFKPTFAIADEFSSVNLAVMMCQMWYVTIQATMAFGDAKQIPPVMLGAHSNEFSLFGAKSALDWFLAGGVRYTRFKVQYRGNPELFDFVKQLAFQDELSNGDRLNAKPEIGALFRDAMAKSYSYCTNGTDNRFCGHRYLVDVVNGKSYAEVRGTSLVNLAEVRAAHKDLIALIDGGIPPSSIAVLFYYQGSKKAFTIEYAKLRQVDFEKYGGVQLSTVDAFQGNSADIVMILTTATVQPESKVGLSEHVKSELRLTVADSRAKEGIVWYGGFIGIAKYVCLDGAVARRGVTRKPRDASCAAMCMFLSHATQDHPLLWNKTVLGDEASQRERVLDNNSQLRRKRQLAFMPKHRAVQLEMAGRKTPRIVSTMTGHANDTAVGAIPYEMGVPVQGDHGRRRTFGRSRGKV